jgi:hypothetical protein
VSNAIDNALEAMRHANPVSDQVELADAMLRSSVFLTATKETTVSIDTKQSTQQHPTSKQRTSRRNVMALAGAFAVAIVAVAIVATANTGDSISLTGASSDPAATEAFIAVEDAYTAFNTGDARWVEIRNQGSVYESATQQERLEEHLLAVFAAAHTADARLDVLSCESHGSGTWPDVADGGPIDGYKFTCNAVRTDSFHGGAGMQLDESFVWVASDGEIIAVTSEGDLDAWFGRVNHQFGLTDRFYFWLADAYPRVASEMTFVEWQAKRMFPSIESLPIALEYVDEFVAAQS